MDGQLVKEKSFRTENENYSEVWKRIGTRLRTGRSGVPVPAEARDLSLVQTALGPKQSLIVKAFFSGVKRPGHDNNHSPPSSPEVKNEWSHTSARPIRPHRVNWDKIIFLISYIYSLQYIYRYSRIGMNKFRSPGRSGD
jgi:hypothetical protein